MSLVSEEDVDAENVQAARQMLAERIWAWCSERHAGQTQAPGGPPLRCLTQLDLATSGLRALPPPQVLGALPCLRILNLGRNKLKCLCGGLLQCSGLEELYLDDNYLTSIRGELKNLHCLRVLSASRNSIFSAEVGALSILQISDSIGALMLIRFSPVLKETVNELKQMHRIEVVDLRQNHLCCDSTYALLMWRTLPNLSLLDGRGKFQDSASFAAIKRTRKQAKGGPRRQAKEMSGNAHVIFMQWADTKAFFVYHRKKKQSSEATVCERFHRSQLRKVYLSKSTQTAVQENTECLMRNSVTLETHSDL
ncbi:unnamed protein product [Hydatigera taeniaeformis]|uniref:LRC72 protein n=1 Tax=Hydatigena taeniaeformis TaxID=6205 RepID=A0A0R3WJQ2_HYDTA|nr:unnamed protein product [Hydatigera taeniaeformis]